MANENIETIIHVPSKDKAHTLLNKWADKQADGSYVGKIVRDSLGSCTEQDDAELPILTGFKELDNGICIMTFKTGMRDVVDKDTKKVIGTKARQVFFSIDPGTDKIAMSTPNIHLSMNRETGDIAVAVRGTNMPDMALPFDTSEEFMFQMSCSAEYMELGYRHVYLFREMIMACKEMKTA